MNVLIKGKYGSVTNNYGVVITKREMNRWRDAIPKANRVIAQEKRLRRMSAAKYGEFSMDFRDSDLNRFQTKKAFLSYLKTAEQLARGTYFRNKAIAYRQNYIKSLEINYGSLATKLIKKIKRMPLAQFRHLVETDRLQSIGFIYYESEAEAGDSLQAIDEVVSRPMNIRGARYSKQHQSFKARATIHNRRELKEHGYRYDHKLGRKKYFYEQRTPKKPE